MSANSGRLLYDATTGRLLYDATTGRLLYSGQPAETDVPLSDTAMYLKFAVGQASDGTTYPPVADALALAMTDIDSETWSLKTTHPFARKATSDYYIGTLGGSYYTTVDLRSWAQRFLTSPYSGSSLTKISINCVSYNNETAQTFKIALIPSASSTPDNSWSTVTGAEQLEVAASGSQQLTLSTSVMLSNYLYLVTWMDTFTPPTTAGNRNDFEVSASITLTVV